MPSLTIFHGADMHGICGGCYGLFKPDKTSKTPAEQQIREQFANHNCDKLQNFGNVVPPAANKP